MRYFSREPKFNNEERAEILHELRTPIAICNSAIDLAIDENDKEEIDNLLRIGKKALIRQNDFIGNLMERLKNFH